MILLLENSQGINVNFTVKLLGCFIIMVGSPPYCSSILLTPLLYCLRFEMLKLAWNLANLLSRIAKFVKIWKVNPCYGAKGPSPASANTLKMSTQASQGKSCPQ